MRGKLELHIQRVPLEPICNMVVATARGWWANARLNSKEIIPTTAPVWADEGRVRQVLLNLYSNAAKFTESGAITLSVRETDEGVRISVKDTGKGIDPQYHEVIFEEFKQADAPVGATRVPALVWAWRFRGICWARCMAASGLKAKPAKAARSTSSLPAYQELASKPKLDGNVFPAIVEPGKPEEKVEKVV